jgi:parallel beta-helix repeat protein
LSAIALAGNMIDPGGGPAAGCKLTSCIRGTSTPSPLYSDVGLATPTTNPYVGDADGRLEFYYSSLIQYTWTVRTSDNGTILWQADVVGGVVMVTYINGILIDGSWGVPLSTTYRGVEYVANYAALTSIPESNLSAGAIVHVAGRVSTSDGGAGPFRVVAGSALTENGGTVLDHDTADFQFERLIESDCYIAGWWGATFSALQAAVTAACADNYPLFWNPGVWVFGATDSLVVNNKVRIYGAGPATILRAAADRTVPVISITGASADKVKIGDFRIETTFSGSPTSSNLNCGIVANSVDDLRLHDIECEGRFYIGIRLVDVSRYWLENLYVRGSRNRQVFVEEGCFDGHLRNLVMDGRNSADTEYADYCLNISPAGVDSPKRLTVQGIIARGFTAHGVSIAEDFDEAVFSDIICETATSTAVGFLVQDDGGRARNVQATNITCIGGETPILIKGTDQFNGTNLIAKDAAGSIAGIYVLNSTNVTLTNCKAFGCADAGILVHGNSLNAATDITLIAPHCSANGGVGLEITGGAGNGTRRIEVIGAKLFSNTGAASTASSNCDEVHYLGGVINSNGAAITNSATSGSIRNVKGATNTAIAVAEGGTAGTTQSAARSGIGAAASGANTDITSLAGTATNDNAAAGKIGEYFESEVLVGSAVSLTSTVGADVTSLSLTAGDWDVWGNVAFNVNAATVVTNIQGAINTTSATVPTRPGKGAVTLIQFPSPAAGATLQEFFVGQRRLSLSATTTVYLVASSNFSTNTNAAYGILCARRAR